MIIDDDARNIFALEASLKVRDYKIQSFLDVQSAVDWLKTNDSGLILLDMMMPEIDGYEALKIIRDIPGKEKAIVVAVTAQAMDGDREKCLDAGADEYVSKPINLDNLLDIIKKYIN